MIWFVYVLPAVLVLLSSAFIGWVYCREGLIRLQDKRDLIGVSLLVGATLVLAAIPVINCIWFSYIGAMALVTAQGMRLEYWGWRRNGKRYFPFNLRPRIEITNCTVNIYGTNQRDGERRDGD